MLLLCACIYLKLCTYLLLVCTGNFMLLIYVTCMYSYVTHVYLYVLVCYFMLLVCTCMYTYVAHMYMYPCGVLVKIQLTMQLYSYNGKIWVHGLIKLGVWLVHLSYSLQEEQFGKPIFSATWNPTFLTKPTSVSTLRVPGGSLEPLIFAMRCNTSMPFSFSPAAIRYRGDSGSH